MKRSILTFAFIASFAMGFSIEAHAQNLTTVSASNITDINGAKLAAGQLCFLITDQQDNPISVSIGGGGQALKRGYCSPVAAGVVTAFTVPNPSATSPSGIYYRVTVKDSSTGQEVLRYSLVSFTGATFNFDNYAPTNLAQGAPLSGTTRKRQPERQRQRHIHRNRDGIEYSQLHPAADLQLRRGTDPAHRGKLLFRHHLF